MKTVAQLRAIWYRLLTIPYVLLVVALIYLSVYLRFSSVPGNDPSPPSLGWWAWFDQSQYLKAAQAFATQDFLAEHFFYPPLYSALGSLFLIGTSDHPFLVINLICLLWFVYVCIRLSDLYVPRTVGVFLLFASIIFPKFIFENFVIPWTSTLSTALLATGILGLVWVQEIKQAKCGYLKNWQVLIVAISLGLMVPTRPVDAIVGIVIGCGFILSYLRMQGASTERPVRTPQFLGLTLLGALVGPTIFIGFNLGVHGAPLGNYLQVAGSHGFLIADLPEKFYSIWLNAQPLYGEVRAGLVQRYPWLLLALAGLVWALLRGDFLLRTLGVAMMVFFILYLPYGDLLPTGMWRYLNIHYFKWTFPILALFAAILLKRFAQGVRMRSSWQLPIALLTIVPLLLLSLQMKIMTGPLLVMQEASPSLKFDLPTQAIDFMDIKGLTGQFTSIYFGTHTLKVDSEPLKLYRDFRLLEHGGDIRLLFIRPVKGRQLELLPDRRLQLHDEQLNAQWGRYHFTLGLPASASQLQAQKVFAAYRLGQAIDFSNQGLSHFYIGEGFSISENQGRWTMNDRAFISLRLLDFLAEKKTQLVVSYKALLAKGKECQQVIVQLNQQKIGSTRLCIENKGDTLQTYRYEIPFGAIGKEGIVQIQIETPDSISARQLKINTDERKLGIYVQTLVITQY